MAAKSCALLMLVSATFVGVAADVHNRNTSYKATLSTGDIIITTNNGTVRKLNAVDGSEVWNPPCVPTVKGAQRASKLFSSPVISGALGKDRGPFIYFGSMDHHVYAISPLTGCPLLANGLPAVIMAQNTDSIILTDPVLNADSSILYINYSIPFGIHRRYPGRTMP